MRVIELTMTGSPVQVTPNTDAVNASRPIYASLMVISPATAAATLGNNTVTATKGIPIGTTTPLVLPFSQPKGSLLSQYWLVGTNGDKVEILYEEAQ